jgi:hypothetical protein
MAVYASPSVTFTSTAGMSGHTPVTEVESVRADRSWPQMSLPGTATELTAHQVTPSGVGQVGLLLLKMFAAAS